MACRPKLGSTHPEAHAQKVRLTSQRSKAPVLQLGCQYSTVESQGIRSRDGVPCRVLHGSRPLTGKFLHELRDPATRCRHRPSPRPQSTEDLADARKRFRGMGARKTSLSMLWRYLGARLRPIKLPFHLTSETHFRVLNSVRAPSPTH